MPYSLIRELPYSVRSNLPAHAQEIYRQAFNRAWQEYADSTDRNEDASREVTAHKVAWSVVKQKYSKDSYSGRWKPKDSALSG